jgi:hypothetical protein
LQNDWVEPFKFRTSITGGKMPVNTLLAGILFGFPRTQLFIESLNARDSLEIPLLGGEDRERTEAYIS